MRREKSNTGRHILDVTEAMLAENPSNEVRVEELAKLANVSVPTIYYHFHSRNQLIAEAQASAYFKLIEPLHGYLDLAEGAIAAKDQPAYVQAVGDNLAKAWAIQRHDDQWKVTRLLIDIWADPTTQMEFCELLDVQLGRWINVIDASKQLGWTDPDIDTMAVVTTCWAGSVGQSIFVNSTRLHYTPEGIRDFYMKLSGVKAS